MEGSEARVGWSGGRCSVLRPSPFRGLAFSISVRTDRMGCAFSPLGLLFRGRRNPILDPPPAFPFLPVYLGPSLGRTVQVSVNCFQATSAQKEKKRKFVCAWSSVPGNRLMGHRSADAILGTVCDSQSLSSVRLDHCTPLPPSPPSSVLDPSCWPFRQQTRFFVDYHGFTTRHHHAPTLPVHHPAIARLVEFKTPTLLFSSFPAVSQTQSSQSCRFGWLPSSRLRPQLSYPFCNQSFFGHPKLGLAHPPSLSSHSRERASPAQHPQQHAPKLRINTPRLSSASKRSRCVKLDAPLRPESY